MDDLAKIARAGSEAVLSQVHLDDHFLCCNVCRAFLLLAEITGFKSRKV